MIWCISWSLLFFFFFFVPLVCFVLNRYMDYFFLGGYIDMDWNIKGQNT